MPEFAMPAFDPAALVDLVTKSLRLAARRSKMCVERKSCR